MRVVGHAGIHVLVPGFPFLFGGTFIEGGSGSIIQTRERNFPSFLEGLSLRRKEGLGRIDHEHISLPSGKGFH